MQEELKLSRDSFRLVRIGEQDARHRTDDFFSLRELVMRSEESYPQISRWFDAKVTNGLRSGERTGFLGLVNEQPIAAAILKRGQTSKFCHLKIDDDARSRSLGDLFFTLMTLEIRRIAKRVRFTLPESVWEERKQFFNSFRFATAAKSSRQYRLFDEELFSEAGFPDLFEASKSKLRRVFGQLAIGNHSLLTGAVLALHPVPLHKVLSGEKTVEIRTRFSDQWEGRRVSLYATQPISGLAGEAKISRVIRGKPDRIWEVFGHMIGCSRLEYDAYVADRETVCALLLEDVKSFSDPVPLSQLSFLLDLKLAPPQSYLSLENNDGWLAAVALAAALQGSIGVSRLAKFPSLERKAVGAG